MPLAAATLPLAAGSAAVASSTPPPRARASRHQQHRLHNADVSFARSSGRLSSRSQGSSSTPRQHAGAHQRSRPGQGHLCAASSSSGTESSPVKSSPTHSEQGDVAPASPLEAGDGLAVTPANGAVTPANGVVTPANGSLGGNAVGIQAQEQDTATVVEGGSASKGVELKNPSGALDSPNGAPGSGETTNGAPKSGDSATLVKSEGSAELEASGKVEEAKEGWQRRWTIVALCFFAFLLCNMDRVNMSIAILPMGQEFNWDPSTVGLVQSSFFWGYLLTQVAGGVWADTYGGKQVLGFGVIWWSMATVLTPFAAKMGLPALLFARACMGIGEGVAMPAMNNLLSKWVPVGERSRSLALVYSGMYLGSVVGLSLSPGLINKFGWPSVFYSFGSLGIVWFYFWIQKAKSNPGEDPSLSPKERALLLGTGSAALATTPQEGSGTAAGGGHFAESPKLKLSEIPWGLLLSKGPVWAIIICHFCHNWGVFILLTWMPTYYHDVLGFNLTESGLLAVLPWLTMAVASNAAGWLADWLISKGVSVTTVRKVMQTIGFLGPALCLSLLPRVTSPVQAVLLLMASQGTDAFSQSGLYSNHQDIGPQYAGILLGLSNTAGVLAGVLGTYVTGRILQNGSWDQVFEVAVVLYLVGTVVWNTMSTGKRVFH